VDTAENYSTRNLIADIWHYVKPYKGRFWLALIAEIISDVAYLYPPYALAVIIDFFSKYTPGMDLETIYLTFTLSAIALIVIYASAYVTGKTTAELGEKIELDAQNKTLQHAISLDIAWHEKESTGNKYKRIERGARSLNQALQIFLNDFIDITIAIIGTVIIIFNANVIIGSILIVFLGTYWMIKRFFRKKAVFFTNITNKKEEERSGIFFEAINNVRSIKTMSMGETILRKLSKNAADIFKNIINRIFWNKTGQQISSFYTQIFQLCTIIFIVYGIVEGNYTIGLLVLFTGYFNRAYNSMHGLAEVSERFVIAKNSVQRMQDMLAIPVTIDDETGKVPFPQDWQEISLKNISFSYNNKPVLRNISFTVKRGEKIGVVGLSGAGKSTLFKLLLKEHESYKGTIAFDGVPLTGISKKDYFNYVAVVLQETELFNASLKDNVTITNQKQEKNKALLDKALATSHVKDFMPKLPKGTNTIIGEKGVKLSGGEKQRVGIARAIFKDPQIFLLDEATSHLDIESEEKIQDSLHAFFGGVTAIVIAHRLTTIKEMDRILVIEDGKILESGTFTELHAAQGRFYELWEKQKL